MKRVSIDDVEKAQQTDFQDRVVLQFLKRLGYTDIEEEPKYGNGKADYLVRHSAGGFYVEAHSPSLEKRGVNDPITLTQVESFERLLTSRVQKRLPNIHKYCCLEGSFNGLIRGDMDAYTNALTDELKPWEDRVSELPRYGSSEKRQYQQFEGIGDEEVLKEVYGVSIPYPYGVTTVPSTKDKKQYEWRLRWRLLRKHEQWGPRIWCWFGRGGGEPSSGNMAKGINKKSKKARRRLREDPSLKGVPYLIFMDGRPLLRPSRGGDFVDLDIALSLNVKWESGPPTAVVIIGTWGVPMGVSHKRLEALSETSADMVFNPCSGPTRPVCLNPFILRKGGIIRLWSISRHLLPVE